MERFIKYLHTNYFYGQDERRIVNVYKRINDVVTDYKQEYDNFNFINKRKRTNKKMVV